MSRNASAADGRDDEHGRYQYHDGEKDRGERRAMHRARNDAASREI